MRKKGFFCLLSAVIAFLLLFLPAVGLLPGTVAATGISAERGWPAKTQVSAGSAFTAAVRADGTLWTWGYDQRVAQLGINALRPEQVGRDTNWSAVSGGGDQIAALSAALKTDGTLWTWGWRQRWDLDRYPGDRPITSKAPMQVGRDTDWAAVSVGGAHFVALKTDGTLWTWGANRHGQLGDGTTTPRNVPVQVGRDTDWTNVSAGASHTVALKRDGVLWAWGWNLYGQLGIGTGGDPKAFASHTSIPPTYADEHTPVQVGKDRDWVAVSAGSGRTAAIKSDGTLWVWGMHGIVATGVDRVQVRPLRVGQDTDWAVISLGNNHAVAVKTDGTLWAWGVNDFGKLGIGIDPVPGRPNTTGTGWPMQVGRDRDWATVSVGSNHTAALKADGTLWTWGWNLHGQLGGGNIISRNSPTIVTFAPVAPGTSEMIKLYPRQQNGIAANSEAAPFIENGRTLVPLRFLGEWLGAVFRWEPVKKEVTFTKGTVTIRMRLGESKAHIHEEGAAPRTVPLDAPVRAVRGRTVVPLRFVSENLGVKIIWTDVGTIIVHR